MSAIVSSAAGTVNAGSVTFTVTDSGNNQVGSPVSGNVSNGGASVSFVPTGLAPGSYTITASFHDPAGNRADSSGTGTLTITPGPPASVTLDPGDTSAVVGTMVTETATVKDPYGNLVADGTTVQWSITGATSGTASVSTQDTTTTNGQATLTYTNTTTGQDTVGVTAGTEPDTANTSATVTWTPGIPASVTLDPGNTTGQIGATVTETATVKDQYGNLVAHGTTVDFSVSGTNSTSGSPTTNAGKASFTYGSSYSGSIAHRDGRRWSNPSQSASITWTVPASTARSTLTILNIMPTFMRATITTGAAGSTAHGAV